MKKVLTALALSFALTLAICSCASKKSEPYFSIDEKTARPSYGADIFIEPLDESVTVGKNKIVIAPHDGGRTYTLSGYFNGQILSTTKNTALRLNNVYLESTDGKPALRVESKTEISTAKDSVNFIVSAGRNYEKDAALEAKRTLILGGSGTLYVKGNVYHGIEADDVKIKGTGKLYSQGTLNGSALNCKSFSVEEGKAFSAYFINSKNGIKADGTINIAGGNFYFFSNGTALKTDTAKKSPKNAHAIKLLGGTFHTHGNAEFFRTEPGAYFVQDAEFIEEKESE